MSLTFSIPNSLNFPNLPKIIVCLLISAIIIYPVLGLSSVQSILAMVILFILLYVILQSMSNSNLQNELPSTLYPSMPHLGLDGISLNNYVSGLTPKSYV
jgi:hypothetical protein